MGWGTVLILWMLGNLAIAPWVIERARTEMDRNARRAAPGGFANLPSGLTHYQWHGPTHGPVIVMIHGLVTPSWVFDALVPGLIKMGFRVLTYDLYGRGFSDRPSGKQDEVFFLTQLEELLDALEIEGELSLFGFSMGGAIATAYTAKHASRVDRLMLLAPAGMVYHPGRLLRRCARAGIPGNWIWDMFGGWILRRAALEEADLAKIPDLYERIAAETRTRGYLRAILSSERHILAAHQESEHRAIAATPTAVISIWGQQDKPIPLAAMGKLTEWNRQCYKHEIKGAGHGLAYTHPDEIIAALREHLREV